MSWSISARRTMPDNCTHSSPWLSFISFSPRTRAVPLGRTSAMVTVRSARMELACDASGPAAALVFKTLADDFVGRLSYFRVVSGTISSDGHLFNMQKDSDERPANLSRVLGKELIRVDKLVAGEIGAVTKLNNTTTFDTLATEGSGIVIPAPALPPPALPPAKAPPLSPPRCGRTGPSVGRAS